MMNVALFLLFLSILVLEGETTLAFLNRGLWVGNKVKMPGPSSNVVDFPKGYLNSESVRTKIALQLSNGAGSSPTIHDLLKPEFWRRLENDGEAAAGAKELKQLMDAVLEDRIRGRGVGAVIVEIACSIREEQWGTDLCAQMEENSEKVVEAICKLPEGTTTTRVLERYANRAYPNFNSNTTRLHHFDLSVGKKTFYVANNGLDFRHKGRWSTSPTQIFLCPPMPFKGDDEVQVFFGASGTGKSIELAGSAYTRGADLALVWSRTPDMEDVVQSDKSTREELALIIMSQICDDLKSDSLKELLSELLNVAARKKQKLRLVLCMDEMSYLPIFVRTLIANRKAFADRAILEFFPEGGAANVDVLFSIAGTGISRGGIGSQPENFSIKTTSASADPESVYKALQKEDGSILQPWETIKERYPVLFSLMEHNGRMLSIIVMILGSENAVLSSSNSESRIVHQVLQTFIDVNAISSFESEHLPLLGACALAVLLFQEPVSVNKTNVEDLATKLDYGVTFAESEYKGLNTVVSIKTLVQKAGLLVPAAFPQEGELQEPFELDNAMQLLCIYLLSAPPKSKSLDMLDLTYCGFEAISTNLVKCAIAASMVVSKSKRMNVRKVLEAKLGFFTQDTWRLRQDGVPWTLWNELSEMKAACIGFTDMIPTDTYHHKVEAEIVEAKTVAEAYVEVLGNVDGERAEKGLRFDKEAMRRLLLISTKSEEGSGAFIPPVSSVAYGGSSYGGSSLADGYVTFLVEGHGMKYLCTIMIQSKVYFGNTLFPSKKVIENGERCYQPSLEAGFGTNRLFCAAACQEKLTMQREGIPRNFVGYAVDKSSLLATLMGRLDARRDPTKRFQQHRKVYVLAGKCENDDDDNEDTVINKDDQDDL